MLRRSSTDKSVAVPPEESTEVKAAEVVVERIAHQVQAAEEAVRQAELRLQQAESRAAQAILDGEEPASLEREREGVRVRMDRLQVLWVAEQEAKQRRDAALAMAQQAHRAALWSRYQASIKVMIESGDAFAMAQNEVMRCWNACDQPGEAPVFRGTWQIWREYFRAHLVALSETPVEQAPHGSGLPPVTHPRAY
jgi:hypothetical protein